MLLPLLLALPAAQTTVTLTATDSKAVSSLTNEDFNDNTLRSAWDNPTQGYIDGLVKFDLSSIPNKSAITAMSLRLFHQGGSGSPFANPTVEIWRSNTDSWARGQNDIHPELTIPLTGAQSGFPSTDLAAVDFALNAYAANWSFDLTDDVLTLLLRNTAGDVNRVSYVNFYGSDASPAPPQLTLTYTNKPGLTVYNLRHNVIAVFSVYNAKPGSFAGVLASKTGPGPSQVVSGPCGSTTFNLSPRVYLLGTAQTSGAGTAIITWSVPIGAAGVTVWIQGIDYGVCRVTSVFTGVVG